MAACTHENVVPVGTCAPGEPTEYTCTDCYAVVPAPSSS